MEKSPENPRIKQPYAIFGHDKNPLFFAALKPTGAGKDGEEGGIVILTAASHGSLKPIHDRRPLALPPDIARQWLDTTQPPPSGDLLADVYSLPSDAFECYPVAPAVGSVRNDSPELLTPITNPRS
jgi:putative SOS response-associated peptidase YedK